MDHALTEEQALLQRSVADFFAKEFPLDRIRDFRNDPERERADLWRQIGAMGWNAAAFPEAIGGYPGSLLDAAVIIEQLGRAAAPSPYVHSTVAAGLALAGGGSPLAAEVANGIAVVIPVPLSPGTGAPTSGDSLDGDWLAVPWTALATHYAIPTGSWTAIVEASAVKTEPLANSGVEPVGKVIASGAIPSATLDPSFNEAMQLNGAAGGAMFMAGASARALDVAVAFMKERIQFGKPIGAFQALQHRAADMAIQVEISRYLSFKAASLHGTPAFARSARYAKTYTSEAANRVCREAIQMHGGAGFVDDHKVQLFYRLCGDLSNAYGNAGEHRSAVTEMALAAAG